MTPKEKAEEIYYNFTTYAPLHKDNKQCALIAVNEILKYIGEDDFIYPSPQFEYWKEVKEEINKL